MKFTNYLVRITGVETYPLLSMILFMAFFAGMTWYIYKTPRQVLEKEAMLPLDQ